MKKCFAIFCFKIVTVSIVGITPVVSYGQLDADISSTDNSNCSGAPCGYNGPSILINELMMSPNSNDGSLWGGSTTQRGEWIELYNPNICESIDISCYYLGNNADDSGDYPGGYVIPPGTVVPPAGFALIRGENAAPVPANLLVTNGGNVVELVVDDNSVCVGGGSRLWFPNSGGWFGFYDSNGFPQDAVSWATQANVDEQPCVPASVGCGYSGALSNFTNFPAARKNYILNTSAANFQGQSIRRIPNGGPWSGPSSPTYALNNVPPPNPPIIICNGTATAIPTGGNPPYTYVWDDPLAQTGQTADSLCAGVYCVLISDALGNSIQQCVTVVDFINQLYVSEGICPGGTYTFPDGSVATQPGTYPIVLQTAMGCDSLVTYSLGLFPSQNYIIDKQICDGHFYTMPDGSQVGVSGTYEFDYQNLFGCDSSYTVNLVVTDPIHLYVDTLFCEGSSYELPDGTETLNEGYYEILVPGDPTSCDTLFAVTLAHYPDFQIDIDDQNDISCFGQADGAISISVAGTTGPFVYDWSDGIDHDSFADSLSEGEYIINVSDTIGCQKNIAVMINEPDSIGLSLSGDTLICLGSEAHVLAVGNGGTGGLTYHWETTDADSANIVVTPIADTGYTVYAEDENGCVSATLNWNISVISMDIGLLTISSDTAICPGDTVSVFASYLGTYPPYDFNWTGGIEAGEGPHDVSPDATTTYVLSVSDVCGNELTDEILVELFAPPEAVVPDLLISGCRPLSVALFDSINTSSDYTHEWLLSTSDSYFGNPVDFILNETGIYEVSLIVTSPEGCSASSESTMPIEVYETPIASFNASAWAANVGDDIVFTDNSSGSVFNNWLVDESTFENQTEVSYSFPDTGSFAIQLVVENEFGCSDTLTQWVAIDIGYQVEIPNAFTPTGGSGDDPYYDPTSTTNTVFYPFLEYVDEYRMSIFNRWGELIFETTEKEKGWNGTYRDEPCPQDVYVYKIELVYDDGKKATKAGDITLFR